METAELYTALAGLFEYPGADYRERVAHCVDALALAEPDAGARLEEFLRQTHDFSAEELQELYIQSFDLNPSCALDLGWHLFGENYDRGRFLVKMREQLRRFGLAESNELPDHLSHALALLARMPAAEAEEFGAACVLPALEKIRAGSASKPSAYTNLIEATAMLLRSRLGPAALETVTAAPELRVLNGGDIT